MVKLRFSNDNKAKEKPDSIPQMIPSVNRFDISNEGITKTSPNKTIPASITSRVFSFSLYISGSRKVTNNGKEENVTNPMATVEM